MRNGPQHEPAEAMSFEESLWKLQRLSAKTLHETSARIRSDLSGAEWKMGLCLLASVRENRFRQLGFANITQYAEEALGISGKKAGSLLAIARLLEHLPLCAAAFRNSDIDWCKLRALQSVLTPETERQWLEFAICHRTNEVEKKVAMAPKDWKRQGGMAASVAGSPIATEDAVDDILKRPAEQQQSVPAAAAGTDVEQPGEVTREEPIPRPQDGTIVEPLVVTRQRSSLSEESGANAHSMCEQPSLSEQGGAVAEPIVAHEIDAGIGESIDLAKASDASKSGAAGDSLPIAPRLIRLVVEMTPDQYALYESAESRIRGLAGKKVSRAEVIARMAKAVLNGGTARSRSKYQILVYTDAAMETGWYDTERGPLPVSPEVLDKVKAEKTLPLAPRAERKERAQVEGSTVRGHGAAGRTDANNAETLQEPHDPNESSQPLTPRAGTRNGSTVESTICPRTPGGPATVLSNSANACQATANSDTAVYSNCAGDSDGPVHSDGVAHSDGAAQDNCTADSDAAFVHGGGAADSDVVAQDNRATDSDAAFVHGGGAADSDVVAQDNRAADSDAAFVHGGGAAISDGAIHGNCAGDSGESVHGDGAASSAGVIDQDFAVYCGPVPVDDPGLIPKSGRVDVPNWMVRAVMVRAGFRCQNCGQRGVPLDLHHCDPVSEGGRNDLETLRAYCKSCHSLKHEKDFASKPAWQRARQAAQRSRLAKELRADDG